MQPQPATIAMPSNRVWILPNLVVGTLNKSSHLLLKSVNSMTYMCS